MVYGLFTLRLSDVHFAGFLLIPPITTVKYF